MKTNKICLTCGPGGHLDEMLCIIDAMKDQEFFFITVKASTSLDLNKIFKTYYLRNRFEYGKKPTSTKIFFYTISYLILISFTQIMILLKERPNIIVTTGGDETIFTCYFGKMTLGAKIICLESFTRINNPSFTGRVIYPISDLFIVQWKSLLNKYGKRAQCYGKII